MLEATLVVIGERIEAALIAALLIFNVALGAFQEGQANAALALLKQHVSLKARVRRDGRWVELPAALLVPDDVVQLSLAAIVQADMRIAEGSVLLDQSMLTRESVAAESGIGRVAYAGSVVRRGEAVAVVTATGSATYFGRAAELVRIAHVESAEVKAVLGLVRNLSVLNAAIVIGLVAYAHAIVLPASQNYLARAYGNAVGRTGSAARDLHPGDGARCQALYAMMIFSAVDIAVVSTLAISGILMQPLPRAVVLTLLAATVLALFRHLSVD